jgi:hypothetical protein
VTHRTALFKSLLIETVIYALLVAGYFFLVLHFLGDWLQRLFERPNKVPYAAVTLILMLGQGMALEIVTTALLRFVRRKTE